MRRVQNWLLLGVWSHNSSSISNFPFHTHPEVSHSNNVLESVTASIRKVRSQQIKDHSFFSDQVTLLKENFETLVNSRHNSSEQLKTEIYSNVQDCLHNFVSKKFFSDQIENTRQFTQLSLNKVTNDFRNELCALQLEVSSDMDTLFSRLDTPLEAFRAQLSQLEFRIQQNKATHSEKSNH